MTTEEIQNITTIVIAILTNIATIVGCIFTLIKALKSLSNKEKKRNDELSDDNERLRKALTEQVNLTNSVLKKVQQEQRKRLGIESLEDE